MGRVGLQDVEHYGGGGGGSFFSLKNDKDVAKVRIMMDGAEDVENFMFACHEVTINEKRRYVNCLRAYHEPVTTCPFCADRRVQTLKMYIPLYNLDSDQVQIWERGKNFASKLSSIISRYGSKSALVSHIFEIERNGKAGDLKTTYELYEVDDDDTTLEDLPELPQILGSIILDKSADDMNFFLDEGEFPPDEEDDEPVRRRDVNKQAADGFMNIPDGIDEDMPFDDEEPKERERRASSTRRTPSNNSGSNSRRGESANRRNTESAGERSRSGGERGRSGRRSF